MDDYGLLLSCNNGCNEFIATNNSIVTIRGRIIDDLAYIDYVYTKPDYRNKGYASNLAVWLRRILNKELIMSVHSMDIEGFCRKNNIRYAGTIQA